MADSFDTVIDRIKDLKALRWDKRVAEALGTTPEAFCQYRRRGALPISLLREFAVRENVSPHWLLTGEEPPSQDEEVATMILGGLRLPFEQLRAMEPLTAWEQRWVRAFRSLDGERKKRLLAMIEGQSDEMA